MDFRRLEAFCKVYELKSFSKAGTDLFLSQPTISAHVSSLEKDLGVLLFDRLGRAIMATQAGEILYRRAREAFRSLDDAKVEIQMLQDKVAGRLPIGGSTIPAHHLLPEILTGFLKLHPDVQLELHVGDSQDIARRVEKGELAVGVVGATDQSADLAYAPLLQDELILVAAPNMALPDAVNADNGARVISVESMTTVPWVMREAGSGTRKAFEQGLADIGLDYRRLHAAITVESTLAVLQCVKAGLGLSATSRLAAGPLLARGELVEVVLPSLSMHRSFFSVHHSRRHLFPGLRFFLEYLDKETRGLANAASGARHD